MPCHKLIARVPPPHGRGLMDSCRPLPVAISARPASWRAFMSLPRRAARLCLFGAPRPRVHVARLCRLQHGAKPALPAHLRICARCARRRGMARSAGGARTGPARAPCTYRGAAARRLLAALCSGGMRAGSWAGGLLSAARLERGRPPAPPGAVCHAFPLRAARYRHGSCRQRGRTLM